MVDFKRKLRTFSYIPLLYAKVKAIRELQQISNVKTESESGIWSVLDRDNIIRIVNLIIKEAKYDILITADVLFAQNLKMSLINALKKKVTIICVSNFKKGEDTDFFLNGMDF